MSVPQVPLAPATTSTTTVSATKSATVPAKKRSNTAFWVIIIIIIIIIIIAIIAAVLYFRQPAFATLQSGTGVSGSLFSIAVGGTPAANQSIAPVGNVLYTAAPTAAINLSVSPSATNTTGSLFAVRNTGTTGGAAITVIAASGVVLTPSSTSVGPGAYAEYVLLSTDNYLQLFKGAVGS